MRFLNTLLFKGFVLNLHLESIVQRRDKNSRHYVLYLEVYIPKEACFETVFVQSSWAMYARVAET